MSADEDIVVATLTQLGLPLTRENYLRFAYFGTVPEELSAKEELMLPRQFQLDPPEQF